jgi:PAS domain S-box-containing protein
MGIRVQFIRLVVALFNRPRQYRRVVLGIVLSCWSALVAAAGLTFSAEEKEWVRRHPVVRYAVLMPETSATQHDEILALAVGYMDALCARAGLIERFQLTVSNDDARRALQRDEVDILVKATAISSRTGAELPVEVRGDMPILADILTRSHYSFSADDFASLPRMLADEMEGENAGGRISGGQYALTVVSLAAGSGTLIILVWLWSRFHRRGLARQVKRNAALFDAFFSASPAGMAILDRDLRFVRVNEPLAQLHGASPDAHLGQTIEQVVPDLAAIIVPLMREVLLTGRSAHNVEVALRTGGNASLESHWLVSLFPIPAPGGRYPLGVGQVVLDIGDRKRAELALRESENRLRNITDHLPVAVFQYRIDTVSGLLAPEIPTGRFTYLSDGIARILPLERQRLFEYPELVAACIHPDDRLALLTLLSSHRGSKSDEIEWTGRLAQQAQQEASEVSWIQVRASMETPASGGVAISGVVLDVSQLKRAQLALERSRAELRQLGAHRESMVEREHQRLAREFHDELGQLLTTARMHLQLLSRQMDSDVAQARQSVQTVDSMLVDTYRSIKNIASDLRPAALNLGLTAAIEWLVDRMLRPIGIACRVDCASAADHLGDAISIGLFRIVQESLTNIVRHAQARQVSIQLACTGDILRLAIRDDGKGFDMGAVDRVKQFGLLGVAERVTALGGELVIDSAPGAGTHIEVSLSGMPCQSDQSQEAS